MAGITRATTPRNDPRLQLDGTHTSNSPYSSSGTDSRESPRHHIPQKRTGDVLGKLNRSGYSLGTPPAALTGQAAMADFKRRKQQKAAEEATSKQLSPTSPNPAARALQSLMGSGPMSRISDAPAQAKLSEPLRKVAEKITIPEVTHSDPLQTSPMSMASFGTVESTGTNAAMTATATANSATSEPQFVAEPAEMSEGHSYTSHNGHLAVAGEDGSKAVSFSYPGPPPQSELNSESGPSRGMSYPGIQGSPKSPASNKRHKCPYCATDFTRHHNLKSHLLTHSQEKPYVCQTCQSRFRRLHDLKRHTKLHTGERPHNCDKCGRRFARGDALARHNKGPGGCAGRRPSFGGDDDDMAPDGTLDGGDYTGGDDEDEQDPDHHSRRGSEPSRKRAHHETAQDTGRQVYRQHSSTYPPVSPAGRPHGSSVSSMGPPQVIYPGSSTVTSPREIPVQPSPAAGSSINPSNFLPAAYPPPGQIFQQQGMMTESPKPLSPGQPSDQHRLSVDASMGGGPRNRSPSLTTQFQQQHFGRGNGGRTPPQPPTVQYAQQAPHHPVLPPLPPGQPQARSGYVPSLPIPGQGMLQHQHVPALAGPGSNPGSLSSHGRSSGSSIRDVVGQEPADIWAYMRSLEQRFSRMQDEYELRISRLQEEVISLKGQVSQNASYSSDMGQRPY